MLLSILITAMVAASLICGAATGQISAVSAAVPEGAASAFSLLLSIGGVLCLWSGVMELMERAGLSAALARLLCPILRAVFPCAARDRDTFSAISANVSANLLGLGNAATPPGLAAAERMAKGTNGRASNELCRLLVMNSCSIQLIPTTIAAVRSANGAAAPFDILPAVWITSAVSLTAALIACRLFSLHDSF